MPQLPELKDGWIAASTLLMPPQTLDQGEVDAFLRFLFSDLAKRPRPLFLRESAAVTRYLRWLAQDGIPSNVLKGGKKAIDAWRLAQRDEADRNARQNVQETAEIVWSTLSQYGEFEPSTKDATLRFLRRHADTFFTHPYLAPALAFVETHDIPSGAVLPFRRPSLMSRRMSAQGKKTDFEDDLSDRIFAAYHTLPRARVRKRSPKIAAALTASGIGAGVRAVWGWPDVKERVKGYTRSQRSRLRKLGIAEVDLKAHLTQYVDSRVDYWVSGFKFARSTKKILPPGVAL